MVLIKNTPATLVALFTTRRPSFRIIGKAEKSESSNTICDICLTASLPCAIAILQSASFNASISFTPSPLIATAWPFFCNACTSSFFCNGVTLPNTAYCSASCSITNGSSPIPLISRQAFQLWSPACLAIAETAVIWSPDMILIFTSSSRKNCSVFSTCGRMVSVKMTAYKGWMIGSGASLSITWAHLPITTIRLPSSIIAEKEVSSFSSSFSGAPITREP